MSEVPERTYLAVAVLIFLDDGVGRGFWETKNGNWHLQAG
jgi:hypothetical protein